jgi:hypothetical protein
MQFRRENTKSAKAMTCEKWDEAFGVFRGVLCVRFPTTGYQTTPAIPCVPKASALTEEPLGRVKLRFSELSLASRAWRSTCVWRKRGIAAALTSCPKYVVSSSGRRKGLLMGCLH